MRKFIAIIIIIICIGGYYYYTDQISSNKEEKLTEFDKLLEQCSNEDFSTPDTVLIKNNIIIKYLYGGKATPEEVESLISIQRNLFDPELLKINPIETQITKVKQEIDTYSKSEFKIIDIKQTPTEYEKENPNISKIRVHQYTNGQSDIYLEYYMRRQVNDEWKILGWEKTDQFDISEEL